MELTLEPLINITKELILSRVSEEQLMEHYLGVPVTKGLFKSPLRQDRHPTCAFYRNKRGDLIMKDFGSNFCGNFISVVIEKFNCSYSKALRIIANDFGIIKDPNIVINKPKLEYTGNKLQETKQAIIQVEIRDFQQYELDWWASYGITESTLKKFNVFSCKNIFLNGNIFYMEKKNQHVYGYYFGIKNGLERWKCYWPYRKTVRFIGNTGSKHLQGAAQLPKEGGEYLCITKSLKDVLVFYELGIPAIAPNSENLFITDIQYEKLKAKFKNILLVYDNDLPGISNMCRIHHIHPELKIAYIPKSLGVKDISEHSKKYGLKETQKLIDKAKKYYFGKET